MQASIMQALVAENGPAVSNTSFRPCSCAATTCALPRSNTRQGKPSSRASASTLPRERPASTGFMPRAAASLAIISPV
jgi:hypothetical protein